MKTTSISQVAFNLLNGDPQSQTNTRARESITEKEPAMQQLSCPRLRLCQGEIEKRKNGKQAIRRNQIQVGD